MKSNFKHFANAKIYIKNYLIDYWLLTGNFKHLLFYFINNMSTDKEELINSLKLIQRNGVF